MSVEEKLSKPATMYNAAGRAVIITHSYTGHGADDPNGYYYHFEDEPNSRHWISAGAVGIRFTDRRPLGPTENVGSTTTDHRTRPLGEILDESKSDRRTTAIEAAKRGVNLSAEKLGAVSIVSTPKGFCVLFSNDDLMYFDVVEI